MKTNLLAGLALCALYAPIVAAKDVAADAGAAAMVRPSEQGRSVVELANGWHFRKGSELGSNSAPEGIAFNDAGWQQVSVPHTWNRIGTYEAAADVPGSAGRVVDKYMGVGWYRRDLPAIKVGPGRRLWLEFDAASRTAEVWLNGVLLGHHDGGFSRFRFDATDALRAHGPNVLAVKVDNSQPEIGNATADTLPLAGDFFVQGGLYRPVRLVETADTHFAMNDFGGPGVYARTLTIGKDGADVAVLSRLSNQRGAPFSGTVVARLVDSSGKQAAVVTAPLKIAANGSAQAEQTLKVAAPHLWQGTADPYLYSLVVELRDARGHVIDSKVQDFGIRQFHIDPDKGFFINGKHVALHGVGLHQDSMNTGWAMSRADVAKQVATIRDMGANTIRLTHYQHGKAVHDLADQTGLVLWDEIALVTAWTLDDAAGKAPAGIVANARQQLKELIRQNYNHPSVAVWGVANEVDFGPMRPDFLGRGIKASPVDPTPLLKDLAALVAREDPERPATLATCCEDRGMPAVPIVADAVPVSGANRYFGWYYGVPADLGPHLDALHARRPQQPQAITEYGAGAALSIHTDNPLGGPHDMGGRNQPEEYASWVHEQTWPVIEKRPYIWASWLWNAFDFATVTRKEGDSQDINTKGLVSYDGSIRKDDFYYYRAQWSAAPTVHVTDRRYRQRAYPVTDVRVYSNAPVTSLSVNGHVLGALRDCPNRICVWPDVRLAAGANTIAATGTFASGDTKDAITWNLDPARTDAYYIDAGALVAAPGYGSDNFFAGGAAGSTDKFPRGRPAVLAPIVPEAQHDALASFRSGNFSYRLPVKPGRYTVTLRFVEPDAAPGERLFDVRAGGDTVLKGLDVAADAGGVNRMLARSFQIDVRGNTLDLAFVPDSGVKRQDAIVSAIEVVKTP